MRLSVVVARPLHLLFVFFAFGIHAATIQFPPGSPYSSLFLTVGENAAFASLQLLREGDLDQAASVRFYTVDETAWSGRDFVSTDGLVVFEPGATEKWIQIPLLNDGLSEEYETFSVALAKGDVQTSVGLNRSVRVAILDNDRGFSFRGGSSSLSEQDGAARIGVALENDGGDTLSVRYRLVPVDATPGADYADSSGTLVFAPGETLKLLEIPVFDDDLREPAETFSVELFDPIGGVIAPGMPLTIVIFDNDTGLEFEHYPSSVAENAGSISIRVLRGANLGQALSVDFHTTNRLAFAGLDYAAASGRLDFGPQDAAKTVTISILDDWLAEGDESFEIVLANPSGAPLGDRWHAPLTITDDEKPLFYDLAYSSELRGSVSALALQSGGRLLVGGSLLRISDVQPVPLVRLLADGSLDRTFQAPLAAPSVWNDGWVSAIFPLPNGRILASGFFSAGDVRGLVRLHPDGALDETFRSDAVPPGTVSSLIRLANGELLAGGGEYQNQERLPWLLWLNENGTLKANLRGIIPGPGDVFALAAQSDGGILVGGTFNSGTNALFRLRPDMTLDDRFQTKVDASFPPAVRDLAVLEDGRIYVAGAFETVNGAPRSGVARLLPDGQLDEGFRPEISVDGLGVVPRPGGGVFVLAQTIRSEWGERSGAVLLSETGALIPEFRALPGSVFQPGAFVLDQNGQPLAGSGTVVRFVLNSTTNKAVQVTSADPYGWSYPVSEDTGRHSFGLQRYGHIDGPATVQFTTFDGTAQAGLDYVPTNAVVTFAPGEGAKTIEIALLNDGLVEDQETFGVRLTAAAPDDVTPAPQPVVLTIADSQVPASLDGRFTSPFAPFSAANTVAIQADGKVLVGGRLTLTPGGRQESSLARLSQDGSIDIIFQDFHPRSWVNSIAIQPDGKIIAAGFLYDTNSGAAMAYDMARFDPDGSLDRSFTPASCRCDPTFVTLQPDGKILLNRNGGLTRLESNGLADATFKPVDVEPAMVRKVIVTRDGQLLVAGGFTNVQRKLHPGMARLEADGSLDERFQAITINGAVRDAVALSDGSIVIGGEFDLVNGVRRVSLARLTPDGQLDSRFDPGELLTRVGFNGQRSPNTIHALALAPGDKIIVSSGLGWGSRLIRLNPDGSLDPGFQVGQILAQVDGDGMSQMSARAILAIAVYPDGPMLVGGEVSHINGHPRQAVARLRAETHGRQSIGFESAEYVGGEATGHASITLSRVGDLTRPARVQVSARAGSAIENADFVPLTGTVEFGPFATTQTFTIPLLDDAHFETDETVLLTLSNPEGAALDRGIATLHILDDERAGSLDFSFVSQFPTFTGWPSGVLAHARADGTFRFLGFERDANTGLYKWTRLNPDGSIDPAFLPEPVSYRELAGLPDGKLIAASETNLVGLNPDGSVDPGFQFRPGELRNSYNVHPLPDGKILLSGTILNPDGTSQSGYFCLQPDGELDPTFVWPLDPNDSIIQVVSTPDGRLYLCGYFSNLDGPSRRRLARLLPSGELDLSFDPQLSEDVFVAAIARSPDGRLVAAGNLRTDKMPKPVSCVRFLENGDWDPTFQPVMAEFGSQASPSFALAIDDVRRVLLAGNFVRVNGVPRGGITRLHPDGSADQSFEPGLTVWTRQSEYGRAYGGIASFAIQPDGQILILGAFNSVSGAPVRQIARLNGDPAHRFVGISRLATGTVELELSGRADRSQVIEESRDLRIWTPILTNAPLIHSRVETGELTAPARFYRARPE